MLSSTSDSTATITMSATTTNSDPKYTLSEHPYPPIDQGGPVKPHDRPYAECGHFSKRKSSIQTAPLFSLYVNINVVQFRY